MKSTIRFGCDIIFFVVNNIKVSTKLVGNMLVSNMLVDNMLVNDMLGAIC